MILGSLTALVGVGEGDGGAGSSRIELIDLISCLSWGSRGDQRSLDSFLGLFRGG